MTKKNANTFVSGASNMLIELGAVEQPENRFSKGAYQEFKLHTRLGELNITLRKDQNYLYTVSSVFLDNEAVEKAKKELGHWKYNAMYNCEHNTPERAVEFTRCHFEMIL